ncbi:MAG TPA: glycosyl transferase family 4 [Candidatus Nanoarchaeia archaeon]|nr:glycosyl transferase family 4 [Candidatus Nanoarchaeia archaeon]
MYALLSIAISFLATLLLTPYWIRRAVKANLVGEDMHKSDRPKVAEMGGIVVIIGFLFGVLYFIALQTFSSLSTEITLPLLAALTTILIITLIGVIDDLLGWKIGLRQWQKPFLTLIAALPMMVINVGRSQMILPLIGAVDVGLLYPFLIVPIGIVGASNGFNMLAGYNGLEAGMGAIILSTLAYIAWQNGMGWVALIALCMVFSLLAFLVYNRFPARVFPGDSLTYAVGALIAIVAILADMERVALILFIPYFIEFLLKLRGLMQKESFARPNPDNSLEMRYGQVYGLEHAVLLFLKRCKQRVFERDVVYAIYGIEAALALLVIFFQ